MEQSCDRHLYCLNLLERETKEYKLSKADEEETKGRIIVPRSLFEAWRLLLNILYNKAIKIVNYLLSKVGLGRRLQFSLVKLAEHKK